MKKIRKKPLALLCALLALCAAPLTACKNERYSLSDSSPQAQTSPWESVDDTQSVEETSSATEPTSPPVSSTSGESQPPSSLPDEPTMPSVPTTPTEKPNDEPTPPSTPPAVSQAQYIRCTGNNVNLRAGAGTNFAVVGQAKKGTMYAIIAKKGAWYQIYYQNKTVYISEKYTSTFSIKKSNDAVEKVLQEGYKLMGVPYVYGATRYHDGKGTLLKGFSTNQFDCSSLVQYVFYKGGKTLLQTTTRMQVKQGTFVPKTQLQRGDCIYFTNEERQNKTGVERIGHVAVYLGNDYILHTSSDFARIEKMSSTRWNYYVESRRFL